MRPPQNHPSRMFQPRQREYCHPRHSPLQQPTTASITLGEDRGVIIGVGITPEIILAPSTLVSVLHVPAQYSSGWDGEQHALRSVGITCAFVSSEMLSTPDIAAVPQLSPYPIYFPTDRAHTCSAGCIHHKFLETHILVSRPWLEFT